jgi:cytochrome P450
MAPLPTVDLGRWSPWGRFRTMRREFDAIVGRLIARAESDPDVDGRDDVLSMMVRCRYDDGSSMTHSEIADELFTLIAAGHETTATTLAWVIERIRRHPVVLGDLVAEADSGSGALREATITEVQRTRPVIDLMGRQVKAETMPLGPWTIPRGYTVMVSIPLIHDDEALFPNAQAFDPSRFLGTKPDLYEWIPFGGGNRRCIGAAFSAMEMHVVLRTMLRDFTLEPTDEPDERWHSRGIAYAPARGGRAVVHRRSLRAAPPRPSAGAGAAAADYQTPDNGRE